MADLTEVEYVEDVPAHIREIWKKNPFMHDFFKFRIEEIRCGGATVSLKINPKKHCNHRGIVHGGCLTALADSVLGVTAASVGEVVVTVSFTMDFIRSVGPTSTIRVTSNIQHHGRSTMVIVSQMYDERERLICTMLNTMMIVDHFPEIPRHW